MLINIKNNFPQLILHKGKERSVLNFHPWIFSGAVKQIPAGLNEGDITEVYSADGTYLATGHFYNGSIVVRIFNFDKTEAGDDFWLSKITAAFNYRRAAGFTSDEHTNCYRLIHAEGDGLPGLIVDIYNDVAVIQAQASGMALVMHSVQKALYSVYGATLKAIYNKSAEALLKHNGISITDDFIYKSENYVPGYVMENGHRFNIDFVEGQKTGFFLDQRENRQLLTRYAAGKKVLNAFCYSGGFSVYALAAGAALVHSVDSSKKAIELTDENVTLNPSGGNHSSYAIDIFSFFRQETTAYDVIILDPPAFAKNINAVKNAVTGYRNLNFEGIKNIAAGGILFTFSCSHAIDKELFRKIVFQAAAQAKRNVRIMHQLSQPADHPVNIYHPEGEYLKGLVLYVE